MGTYESPETSLILKGTYQKSVKLMY